MDQTKIAIGIILQQGGGNTVYVFDLKHVSVDDRIGTLSILTSSRQPKSVDFVHGVIEPILHCIERQIDINNELSAVRRIKVTRSTVRRSHVVSTPIFDSKDELIGIYVLAGKAAFTQDQIRLCRAIGAKINALRSAPAVSASET